MARRPQPLRPEEISDELKCSICFGLPLKPNITPCEHVFCEDCIRRALRATPSCPNCRAPCDDDEIRRLEKGTFIYRVWSSCSVKCTEQEGGGCSWTGSIADFPRHFEACAANGPSGRLLRLEEEVESANEKVRLSEEKLAAALRCNAKLSQEKEVLMRDSRLKLPVLFNSSTNYYFDRHSVVKLSQLVSRYLENKPHQIDSNRIYQCVAKCNADLQSNWADNPQHYRMDMKMLLATCVASTWFTPRQRSNIFEWIDDMDPIAANIRRTT